MAEVVLQYPQILQRRTWFGITATVNLKSKLMHKAGYGNFLVPHPAAVNWLLRRGLKMKNAISLSIHHEFGHLQTVPFVLLYAGILLSVSIGEETMTWFKILIFAVSTQAVWEICLNFSLFSAILKVTAPVTTASKYSRGSSFGCHLSWRLLPVRSFSCIDAC